MTKITELPAASALTGSEYVPLVQSGVTKRATVADIAPSVANYTFLRAYAGNGNVLQVTDPKLKGTFVKDTTDVTSADNGGTTIIDANGFRWKRDFFGPVNVMWFGAVGDATTDDYAAIRAAIDSVSYWTGIYQANPEVYFPDTGNYYRSSTCIQLKKWCKLSSKGGPGGAPSAAIRFDSGISGIIIHRHNTFNATTAASTTGADGSIIDGVWLIGQGSVNTDGLGGHGIWMRSRGIVRSCLVSGFSGDGIRVLAISGGGGANEGNANGFFIEQTRCQGNGEWGCNISGADANAGTTINLDTANNGTGGLFDNCFLGNVHIQPQAATSGAYNAGYNTTRDRSALASYGGNRYSAVYPTSDANLVATQPGTDATRWSLLGAGGPSVIYRDWTAGLPTGTFFAGNSYRFTGASARNLIINPYEEGGYAPAYTTGPTYVLGGAVTNFTGSRTFGSTAGPITAGTYQADYLKFVTGASWVDTTALQSWQIQTPATGRWGLQRANIDKGIYFYDPNATVANGYGRDATTGPAGTSFFGIGQHARGTHAQQYWCDYGTAPPTGTAISWKKNDIRWNTNNAAGSPIFWICTVDAVVGTDAGTWVVGARSPAATTTATQGAGAAKNVGVNANSRKIQLTTNNANLAAGATVSFVWTNATIAAGDDVRPFHLSGGTAGAYNVFVSNVVAGSCQINITNVTAGVLGEAIVLQIKLYSE
jgi:hypothetical protein